MVDYLHVRAVDPNALYKSDGTVIALGRAYSRGEYIVKENKIYIPNPFLMV
jgi:hypothetical protein